MPSYKSNDETRQPCPRSHAIESSALPTREHLCLEQHTKEIIYVLTKVDTL